MKTWSLLLLFAFYTGKTINAQIVIETFSFEGLKKNNPSYLGSFVQEYDHDTVTIEEILLDVQRLKNIPGIGNAEYRIDTVEGNNNLVFEVNEVLTLLPIVNFGSIKDNVWYQIGLSDYNFKGQGSYLSSHYQNNNGRHSGQFYYRNPFYKGSLWGFSVFLNSWASEEPLFFDVGTVNYDYINNGIGASIIKNFNINSYIELGGTFFQEDYGKSLNQVLVDPPGPDQLVEPKYLTKLEYKINRLDYHFFLLSGGSAQLDYQNVFNFRDQSIFNSIFFLGKYFIKFADRGNFALRFKMAFSTNNYSPFAPFVADSYVNLRGVGNRIDRGTGQVVLNLEYRQTILNAYPFGAQLVVFSDLGGWREPGGVLNELLDPQKFRHFVGGGVRLIYQQVFGAIFRIDYGFDIYNPQQRGIVIGLGQYF